MKTILKTVFSFALMTLMISPPSQAASSLALRDPHVLDQLETRLNALNSTVADGNDPHVAIQSVVREMKRLKAQDIAFRFDPLKLNDQEFLSHIQKVSGNKLPLGLAACAIIVGLAFQACNSPVTSSPSSRQMTANALRITPKILGLFQDTVNTFGVR